jgi:hypothetical protein
MYNQQQQAQQQMFLQAQLEANNCEIEAMINQIHNENALSNVQIQTMFVGAQKKKNYNSNCPHKDKKHYAKVI